MRYSAGIGIQVIGALVEHFLSELEQLLILVKLIILVWKF